MFRHPRDIFVTFLSWFNIYEIIFCFNIGVICGYFSTVLVALGVPRGIMLIMHCGSRSSWSAYASFIYDRLTTTMQTHSKNKGKRNKVIANPKLSRRSKQTLRPLLVVRAQKRPAGVNRTALVGNSVWSAGGLATRVSLSCASLRSVRKRINYGGYSGWNCQGVDFAFCGWLWDETGTHSNRGPPSPPAELTQIRRRRWPWVVESFQRLSLLSRSLSCDEVNVIIKRIHARLWMCSSNLLILFFLLSPRWFFSLVGWLKEQRSLTGIRDSLFFSANEAPYNIL